jgi:hypothetical protein
MKQSPHSLARAAANDAARPRRLPAFQPPASGGSGVQGWRPQDLPPAFLGLVALWQAQRHGWAVPKRAAINPADLPPRLLPYMCVIERLAGPAGARLYMRLAGSGVERAAGRAITGACVEDIEPMPADYADWLRKHLEAAFTHQLPVFAEGVFVSGPAEARALLAIRKVLLPLAADTGDVRFALSAQTFAGSSAPRPAPFLQADTFRPGRAGPVCL